jgi:parallel beta-helix repeat protein
MTEIGATQEFTANIPGQAINTTIDYYLTATDGTDNYSLPLAAPAEFYTFEITGFPPYGLTSTDNHDGTVDINWVEPVDLTNFVDYTLYRSEQEGFTPGAFNMLADNLSDISFVDATAQDFHTYYYIVSANYNYSGTPVEAFSGQSSALLVNNTSQTTVLGYAFLEGRNNHANIKVKFVPESPSAVADSIYTNALGYFETHDLFPGVYSIRLSKPGFQTPLIHEGLSIVSDTDLGESVLYDLGTTVSGDVSGTWSEYVSVAGNITVPVGDSLIIEAGTIVRFLGQYHFFVYGYLACNGADGDAILITSGPANQIQSKNQWYGIDFYDSADDNSYINYTTVEYAYDGIYYEWSAPSIQNSLVQHHERYGVYANRSDEAEITSTTIMDCSSTGIYADYSSPQIDLCEVRNCGSHSIFLINLSHAVITASSISNSPTGILARNSSDPLIDGCEISNCSNQGIYTDDIYQRGTITNNIFSSNSNGIYVYYRSHPLIKQNTFVQNGNGIEIYYNSNPIMTENYFINNTNGIYFNTSSHYCDAVISHSIFAYNTNDGIHKDAYSTNYWNNLLIVDNTIFGNGGDGIQIRKIGTDVIRNNIISDNAGYGLFAQGIVETFENNDLYDNATGAISDLNNLPSETWNFVSFNPNNSADCDIYRNINEDPMFVFADSLDFRLNYESKAIDGGSESLSDPDGSVSDIGAESFDHGNPHVLEVTAFADQTVSLAWDEVSNDSIVEYNVYYMVSAADDDYSLFGSTSGAAIDVTGLTNNVLYDFTVTGVYPDYESIYAPKVSERPGMPELVFDPVGYSLVIPAAEDSIIEDMTLTNNGSRDANVIFPNINAGMDYAYFDGSGDYLSYSSPSLTHLEGMSALTMECWLYRQNNGHFEFMGKNYRNYQFAINDQEKVHFYKGYGNPANSSYQSWNTEQYINANQWYHLAITWEGETVKLYINGEFVWEVNNAVSTPIARTGYAFDLGRRGGENSYYLNGRLAEARVWGEARTQDEIREFMNRSLTGNEDDLLGYWPLQNDFNDHSVYGLTAAVNGNTVLQSGSVDQWAYYSVPQSIYTVAPGGSEVVPLTFYQRSDQSSVFFTSVLYTDDPDQEKYDLDIFLQYGETVPATPVHFIPVPETGKPYTIVIKDAKIDGQTINVGDEIGVFDDELCVGAGIYDGTFNFIFTAWESNGGMDGFTPGNDMVFKMYDTSADLETNEAEETWFIGDDTFGYGAFSALSLEASVYNFQSVAVTGGLFNLVSFNLLPHYPDAWDVFGDVAGLQIAYNDDGDALIPGYNINTIGDINFLDGFYLYSDETTSIEFEGTYIHMEDWDITVEPAKWNYVSVLSRNPVPVTDVFAGLEEEISIVQAASGNSWIPGEGINTIGNMQPGLGYKVALAVDTNVVFNYPPDSKKSADLNYAQYNKQKAPKDVSDFDFTETGLPYAVVIKIKSHEESPYNLVPGDEIGLFDGNLCVGAAVYDGSEQILLTAWEEDQGLELPGFVPGHLIRVRVYNETAGKLVNYRIQNYDGTLPHYGDGNYANIIMDDRPVSEQEFKFQVLPNPFKNNTDVIFNLTSENLIKLNVFDNSGRLVKTLADQQYSADTYRISWNGTDLNGRKLDPGVYFVIAETTEGVYTEKVIILK